jgi:Flp pilus assembly protein TadD
MRRIHAIGLVAALLCTIQARAEAPPQVAWQAYQAGQAALARENFAGAEKQFRVAIHEDRLLSLAHYGLGTVLAATRRYPEALESFQQAIATHRERLALQATQAGKLDQQRDQEIQELRDSIRALESGTVKFKSSQETIALEQRIQQLEREKGREKTAAAAAGVPAEFFVALGSAHHRLGHLDEARAAYEEALKVDPARGEAHNNLAALALARGDKEGAREHVRLAEAAGFRVSPDLKRDAGLDSSAAAAAPSASAASAPAASASAAPAPSVAAATEAALKIEHQPLTCAIPGRTPLLEARVVGTAAPASVRVRFSSLGSAYQYSVRMKADGDRWVTRLPKPKAGLASFSYTIDATDNAAASARTDEITVPVKASAADCPGASAPPVHEALLVEIPDSAPAKPPVPDGFSDEGVKGVGGTNVGWLHMPAKVGAAVGIAAAAGGAALARSAIYKEDTTPPNVTVTHVELLSTDPPAGETLLAPNQPVQATFRITVSRSAQLLSCGARLLLFAWLHRAEAGATLVMTAAGPANANRFCGDSFDVLRFGVDVQADTDFLVTNQIFPASYKVVRVPGS